MWKFRYVFTICVYKIFWFPTDIESRLHDINRAISVRAFDCVFRSSPHTQNPVARSEAFHSLFELIDIWLTKFSCNIQLTGYFAILKFNKSIDIWVVWKLIWRTDNVVGIVAQCGNDVLLLQLLLAGQNVLISAAVVLIKEFRMQNIPFVVELQRVQRVQVRMLSDVGRIISIRSWVIVLVIIELPIANVVVRFVWLLLMILKILVHFAASRGEGEKISIKFRLWRQPLCERNIVVWGSIALLVIAPKAPVHKLSVMRFAARFA